MERRSVLSIAGAVAVLCLSATCVGGGFYVLFEYALGPVVQYGQTLGYTSTIANITALVPTEHGYFCTVRYQYTVENLTYVENRTRTLGQNPYRERRRFCHSYNATRKVTVWYDPRRPHRAALRRTYAGDLWIALNVLDSLALVALGGGMIYYVFQLLAPMYLLCTVHAATGFIATVPVSGIRLAHRHVLAVIPMFSGIVCASIAAYCAAILGGRARARRDFADKSNDWWSHPSDFQNDEESPYENVFQRDLAPAPPRGPSSTRTSTYAQETAQNKSSEDNESTLAHIPTPTQNQLQNHQPPAASTTINQQQVTPNSTSILPPVSSQDNS